ncbi:MAG TPA: uridine kinase [Pseudonocardia sp.]
MLVTPTTRAALAAEVVELVAARPGRVRLVLDGPAPTRPDELADEIATALRTLGRATVVVDAADFLRPASVRLELGRTDSDALLERWLDEPALRREVLDPAEPGASGRVLPRLWDTRSDRAYRAAYTTIPDDGVVLLHGALLLGRGLPFELAVHLRMAAAALQRALPDELLWTVPAHVRYEEESDPAGAADLLVLADHPDRPAVQRRA